MLNKLTRKKINVNKFKSNKSEDHTRDYFNYTADMDNLTVQQLTSLNQN